MAKKFNNKPNNNQQKRRNNNNNNYFVQNSLRYGKDFHLRKRSDELKKDANKIFKDIAFMKGKVGDIIEYFMSVQFVRNLGLVADDMYRYEHATCVGLSTYYQQQKSSGTYDESEKIPEYLNEKTKLSGAYYIIAIGLNNIINMLDDLNRGVDRMSVYISVGNYLKSMSINLWDYRHIL